jgi:hypothetical protein
VDDYTEAVEEADCRPSASGPWIRVESFAGRACLKHWLAGSSAKCLHR